MPPPQSRSGSEPDLRRRCGEARAARPDPHRRGTAGRWSRSSRRRARSAAPADRPPEVRRAATVAAYVSIGSEPGTGALLDALRALGKRVILPVLLPDIDLDWGTCARRDRAGAGPARAARAGRPRSGSTRSRPPTWCSCPGSRSSADRDAARPGRRLLRPGAGPGPGRHAHRDLLYDDEVGSTCRPTPTTARSPPWSPRRASRITAGLRVGCTDRPSVGSRRRGTSGQRVLGGGLDRARENGQGRVSPSTHRSVWSV